MNLLCGPPSNLCVSVFNGHFNAEAAKIRRAPQRKRIKFATFCAKPRKWVELDQEGSFARERFRALW